MLVTMVLPFRGHLAKPVVARNAIVPMPQQIKVRTFAIAARGHHAAVNVAQWANVGYLSL